MHFQRILINILLKTWIQINLHTALIIYLSVSSILPYKCFMFIFCSYVLVSNIIKLSRVVFLSFYYFLPSINLSLPLNSHTNGYVSIMQITKYITVLCPSKMG